MYRKAAPSALPLPRSAWARDELAPWRTIEDPQALADAAHAQARACLSVVLFEVRAGEVSVHDKSSFWPALPGAQPFYDLMTFRAEMYRRFLQEAFAFFGCHADGVFALDLDDLHGDDPPIPVFSFQKMAGSRRLLLPDIDSITLNFYADDEYLDGVRFADKRAEGVFVGSTTGNLPLTLHHVSTLANARLRAGVFFRDRDEVMFSLPAVVQCDSPETSSAVTALNINFGRLGWHEQFGFRYLLSMDGNGATCSRVAIALGSGSVLMKYRSPHLLSYFKALEEGTDFLPIDSDPEVVEYIEAGRKNPTRHRAVAECGRRFYADNLARLHHLRYAAELVNGYLALGRPTGATRGVARHTIDVAARFAPGRHRWRDRLGWVRAGDDERLTGITLYADDGLRNVDLRYAVASADGGWVRARGGEFCGPADGAPVIRVRVWVTGWSRWRYHITGRVIRADGRSVGLGAAGRRTAAGDAPIVGLQLVGRRRSIRFRSIFGRLRSRLVSVATSPPTNR